MTEAGAGLRTAVIELRRKGTPLRFVLFPMVHLGEPAFYEAVLERLRGCDLVVVEGIQGRSRAVSWLTFYYRLVKRGRLGLVEQRLDVGSLEIPVLCPDMSAAEFERGWRQVPLGQRLFMWLMLPIFVPVVFLFGTRERLARHMELEDDHNMGRPFDDFEELDRILVDERDRILVDALSAIHDEHHAEPLRVGVVYGAGHMIGAVYGMKARHGYNPGGAEWLTIFDY